MSTNDDSPEKSTEPKYRDEQWLREKYTKDGLGTAKIADLCDVHQQTIWRWLKRHGIPRRTLSEARGGDTRLHNSNWVYKQYWIKERSTYDIAKQCGVSHDTVLRWMKKHDIERRSKIEAMDIPDELMDRPWLQQEYVENRRTTTDIADELDVSHESVRNWLSKHDIDIRSLEEYTGEEHWSWSGGHANYYGPSWKQRRRDTIERDGEQCVRCGMTRREHRQKYDRDLHVHHITRAEDYRDESGNIDDLEANDLSNLLTLCFQCHSDIEGLPVDTRF